MVKNNVYFCSIRKSCSMLMRRN